MKAIFEAILAIAQTIQAAKRFVRKAVGLGKADQAIEKAKQEKNTSSLENLFKPSHPRDQ